MIAERRAAKKENHLLQESLTQNQKLLQKVNHAFTKATTRIKVLEDKLLESGFQIQKSSFQTFDIESADPSTKIMSPRGVLNPIVNHQESGSSKSIPDEKLIEEQDAFIIEQLTSKLKQL